MSWALMLGLVGSVEAQELRDPGVKVPDAVVAHITPEGLDAVEQLVVDLVPTLLPEDLLVIDDIDAVVFTLEDVHPIIEIKNVQLVPGTGVLAVLVKLKLSLNSESDPLHIGGICDEDGWIGPIDADVQLNISINVVTDTMGDPQFDVELSTEMAVDIDPPGLFSDGDFHLGTCGFLIGGVLGIFEDVLVGILQAPIDDAIGGLEADLEEALSALVIHQELDLNGAVMTIEVEPRQVLITQDGVEILLNMMSDAPQAECIAAFDPGGSVKTTSPKPALTANPPGTQVAAHLADDGVNQLLYAAFRGGVLCYTVSADSGLDLGIPIDSSLLGLLGGDGYKAIIGDVAKPLTIKTRPHLVPEVSFTGAHDITADVRELGLEFYTELDFRQARVLNLEADAHAGVNLLFDDSTGSLSVDVALDPEDLVVRVVPDLVVDGTGPQIEGAVGGIVSSLLPSLLEPALAGLAFAIPGFEGLGLTSLEAHPTGAAGDWLTVAMTLGPVSYESSGCDATDTGAAASGCACESTDPAASDCSSGCNQARGRFLPAMMALSMLWMLRRRQ